MADITVRKLRFSFPEEISFDMPAAELGQTLSLLGLSLTMPHLEPYLIRTMKVALKEITDPALAEDTRRFSQQEGHHYRNHALLNEQVRGYFDADTAAELLAIEAALEADYRRFNAERSLRFNLAYAEGFEAMTCSFALASAEMGGFSDSTPGGEMWAWHMAEEIEHRTVAFDVYEHLVGSYPYRIARGWYAQGHYLGYVGRFARCMARAIGRKVPASAGLSRLGPVLRRYVRTLSPWYDPARIELPQGVGTLLEHFSERALDGPSGVAGRPTAR